MGIENEATTCILFVVSMCISTENEATCKLCKKEKEYDKKKKVIYKNVSNTSTRKRDTYIIMQEHTHAQTQVIKMNGWMDKQIDGQTGS